MIKRERSYIGEPGEGMGNWVQGSYVLHLKEDERERQR